MTANHENPPIRWLSISRWYYEFSGTPGWEFLRPMVALAAWVAEQPWAARLYPCTSHDWLCVTLKPGYHPEGPFFACCSKGGGEFECSISLSVGRQLETRRFPPDEARTAFWNFVRRLEEVARH